MNTNEKSHDNPPWTMFFESQLFRKYDEFMRHHDFSKILQNKRLQLSKETEKEKEKPLEKRLDPWENPEYDNEPVVSPFKSPSLDSYEYEEDRRRRRRRTCCFICSAMLIIALLSVATALVIHYVFIVPKDVEYKAQVNVSVEETDAKANLNNSLLNTGIKVDSLSTASPSTTVGVSNEAQETDEIHNLLKSISKSKSLHFFEDLYEAIPRQLRKFERLKAAKLEQRDNAIATTTSDHIGLSSDSDVPSERKTIPTTKVLTSSISISHLPPLENLFSNHFLSSIPASTPEPVTLSTTRVSGHSQSPVDPTISTVYTKAHPTFNSKASDTLSTTDKEFSSYSSTDEGMSTTDSIFTESEGTTQSDIIIPSTFLTDYDKELTSPSFVSPPKSPLEGMLNVSSTNPSFLTTESTISSTAFAPFNIMSDSVETLTPIPVTDTTTLDYTTVSEEDFTTNRETNTSTTASSYSTMAESTKYSTDSFSRQSTDSTMEELTEYSTESSSRQSTDSSMTESSEYSTYSSSRQSTTSSETMATSLYQDLLSSSTTDLSAEIIASPSTTESSSLSSSSAEAINMETYKFTSGSFGSTSTQSSLEHDDTNIVEIAKTSQPPATVSSTSSLTTSLPYIDPVVATTTTSPEITTETGITTNETPVTTTTTPHETTVTETTPATSTTTLKSTFAVSSTTPEITTVTTTPTTTTTTTEPPTTLPPIYNVVSMKDVTAYTFEPAKVHCDVKVALKWSSLAIKGKKGWRPLELKLYPNGQVSWKSKFTRHKAEYSIEDGYEGIGNNVTLDLIIDNVQCRDGDVYSCILFSEVVDVQAKNTLTTVGKPGKTIRLSLGPSIIENRAVRLTVTWDGGYPIPWTNVTWTASDRNNNSYDLSTYGEYQEFILEVDNYFCQTRMKQDFVIFPKMNLNGTKIIVKPDFTKMKPFVNEEMATELMNIEPGMQSILVIPLDYCKSGKQEAVPHPYEDCTKFVWCLPGDLVVQQCPYGTCFYEKQGQCLAV